MNIEWSGWLFTVIGIASVVIGKVIDRFYLIFVGFEKTMKSHIEIWSDKKKCPDVKLEKLRGAAPPRPHSHIVTVHVNHPVGWLPCCFPVIYVATLPHGPPSPVQRVEFAAPGSVRSGPQPLLGNMAECLNVWGLKTYRWDICSIYNLMCKK